MTPDTLLLFAATYGIAAATPGPATTAVVARVLVGGPRQAPTFGFGILVGDLLLLLASIVCLMTLAVSLQPVLQVVQYVGAAYLLYIAWRFWTAPAAPQADAPAPPAQGRGSVWASGLALALANPKAILFYLALLPAVIQVADLRGTDVATLLAVMVPIFVVVFGAYVVLAARLRPLLTSPRAVRRVHRVSALLMAAMAVLIALR